MGSLKSKVHPEQFCLCFCNWIGSVIQNAAVVFLARWVCVKWLFFCFPEEPALEYKKTLSDTCNSTGLKHILHHGWKILGQFNHRHTSASQTKHPSQCHCQSQPEVSPAYSLLVMFVTLAIRMTVMTSTAHAFGQNTKNWSHTGSCTEKKHIRAP